MKNHYFSFVILMLFSSVNKSLGVESVKKEQVLIEVNSTYQVYGSLIINVTDIMYENIEADPFDNENYPAGSGVVVSLSVQYAMEFGQFNLSLLSAPYDSESTIQWHGFEFELVEVIAQDLSVLTLNIGALTLK